MLPCMCSGAMLTFKLHELLCVRVDACKKSRPRTQGSTLCLFLTETAQKFRLNGINILRNTKTPKLRAVRVEYTKKYFKISHLPPMSFFFFSNKNNFFFPSFMITPFQNVSCPQQDLHKCLCFCNTSRTLPSNKRMTGHAFCPCRNYLVPDSECEQSIDGSMGR